ncbi:hypothetical protein F1C16_09840 [Hymenobacter sp. NBH84]|uniref:hypothetical protein n=1 Tax=Hymenobacter sp. NBH84 TaxID=2596915 RepID=UPI001625D225|nr:hypothetical protein [Hymenobacter sp. NBH84]QNE39835.1 hypothetical protein F1C16_09840 [Hymenobacter sp. NBH84]
MSTSNPTSANSSLIDTLQVLRGGDLTAPAALSQLESWTQMINIGGPGAQGDIFLELQNLQKYIASSDSANISHTLQQLGLLTTKAAEEDVTEEVSDLLRQLGEVLTAASTSLPQQAQ